VVRNLTWASSNNLEIEWEGFFYHEITTEIHISFQIDFGRTMEVTAVATQGHPREQKWVLKYVLKYLLGKNWLTYQESGRDKVKKSNS